MTLAHLLAAGALSLPAAACAWTAARLLEPHLAPRAGVLLWRAARCAPAAPFAALGLASVARPAPSGAAAAAPDAAPANAARPGFEPVLDFAQQLGAGVPERLFWVVAGLYVAGLFAAGVRMASRRGRIATLLASGAPAGAKLETLAARWRDRLGLSPRTAPVRVVDADVSPFVAGLRPVIVAPASLAADAAGEAAIAHELTHVKRGDERDRMLGEVCAAVFWFNPAVRAIERRLAGARELACDADVLDGAEPALRRAYAEAIAELAPAGPAATALLSDLPDLRRRRVRAALQHDGRRRERRALAALAGALVLAAGAPAAGLAGALAERVQPAGQSQRTVSEPVGVAVLEAQEAIASSDFERALVMLDAAPAGTAYDRSVVQRQRAAALYQAGRIDEAVSAFEAALETGALDADETRNVRMNLMQLYAVSEDYARSIAMIEQLTAEGFEPSARQAKLFAQVYVQAGDPASAAPFAEAFIEATPNPSRSELLLLQHVYAETGRTAQADAVADRLAVLADE